MEINIVERSTTLGPVETTVITVETGIVGPQGPPNTDASLLSTGTVDNARLDAFLQALVAIGATGGTGALARLISPTFTTPNIGAATGTSLTVTGDLKSTGGGALWAYDSGGVNNIRMMGQATQNIIQSNLPVKFLNFGWTDQDITTGAVTSSGLLDLRKSATANIIQFATNGYLRTDTSQLTLYNSGTAANAISFNRNGTTLNLASTYMLGWGSTTQADGGVVDTTLSRLAAGVIGAGGSIQSTAGTWLIENSNGSFRFWTDVWASRQASGVLQIGTTTNNALGSLACYGVTLGTDSNIFYEATQTQTYFNQSGQYGVAIRGTNSPRIYMKSAGVLAWTGSTLDGSPRTQISENGAGIVSLDTTARGNVLGSLAASTATFGPTTGSYLVVNNDSSIDCKYTTAQYLAQYGGYGTYFINSNRTVWASSATNHATGRDLSIGRDSANTLGIYTTASGATYGSLACANVTASGTGTFSNGVTVSGSSSQGRIQTAGVDSLYLYSNSGQMYFHDGNSVARMTSGVFQFGTRSLTQVVDITASGNGTFGSGSSFPISIGQDSSRGAYLTSTVSANTFGLCYAAANQIFPCNGLLPVTNTVSLGRADYQFLNIFSQNVTASGTIAGLVTSGTFAIGVNTKVGLYGGASDGIAYFADWSTGTTFTRLGFGGVTSAYPAIKRSGTTVAFRLGDDSADCPITCSNVTASGNVNLPNTHYSTAATKQTVGASDYWGAVRFVATRNVALDSASNSDIAQIWAYNGFRVSYHAGNWVTTSTPLSLTNGDLTVPGTGTHTFGTTNTVTMNSGAISSNTTGGTHAIAGLTYAGTNALGRFTSTGPGGEISMESVGSTFGTRYGYSGEQKVISTTGSGPLRIRTATGGSYMEFATAGTVALTLGTDQSATFSGTYIQIRNSNTRLYSNDTDMLFVQSSNTNDLKYFGCAGVKNPFAALTLSGINQVDLQVGGSTKVQVTSSNNFNPASNNLINLGTSSLRWANYYGYGPIEIANVGGVGSGDRYTIYHTDTTYNRSVGLFHSEDGTEGGLKATSQMHMKPGGNFVIYPSGQSTTSASMAVASSEFLWTTFNGTLVMLPSSASLVPLKLRGAASQSANILECQTSTPTTVFAVGPTGNITLGNGMVFDTSTSSRLFSSGTVRYQSNATTIQHQFQNQIGSSLTDTVVRIETGSGSLPSGGKMLNIVGNSGSILAMTVLASGQTGLGIALPTEKLDVVGNIKASGTMSCAGLTATATSTMTGIVASTSTFQITRANSSAAIELVGSPAILRVDSSVTVSGGPFTISAILVSALPAASGVPYAEINVSDALAPVIGSVVAGGGAAKAKVWSDGTNWKVIGA